MNGKEEMKEAAKLTRDCADILDEMAEVEEEEKSDELLARYAAKMLRIRRLFE